MFESKLEIKREKSRKNRRPSPLGLKTGQKYLNVAKACCSTPRLPDVKFSPFVLLTKHLLYQVGLTQFPATCCAAAATLGLPPPPESQWTLAQGNHPCSRLPPTSATTVTMEQTPRPCLSLRPTICVAHLSPCHSSGSPVCGR